MICSRQLRECRRTIQLAEHRRQAVELEAADAAALLVAGEIVAVHLRAQGREGGEQTLEDRLREGLAHDQAPVPAAKFRAERIEVLAAEEPGFG